MEYLSNLELVQAFAREVIRARRSNYSEQPLTTYLDQHPNVQHRPLSITNKRNDSLNCSLFRIPTSEQKPCIVYLHALGSNRLQSIYLLDEALQKYDVLSFDFGGSGKSGGVYTTFGVWEHQDIDYVLKELTQRFGYKSLVLWGRSMGAVSAVLYMSKCSNNGVKCMVLDSPFSSFQKTALELACCKSSLPEFMLSACLIPLKKCIKENYPFDPFEIDLVPEMKKIHCKVCLIYSQNDKVVHHSSSVMISQACVRYPHIIKIEEDHNIPRKSSTYNEALTFVKDSFFTADRRSRSRGISLSQKQSERYTRLKTQQQLRKPQSSKRKIFPIHTEIDFSPNKNKKKAVFLSFDNGSQRGKQNSHLDNLINKVNNPTRKNRFLFR